MKIFTYMATLTLSGLLLSGGVTGKELPTNGHSTPHREQSATSTLAWMPVYYGYCEATGTGGDWDLTGYCISRGTYGYCHIGRSANCPAGTTATVHSLVTCEGYDKAVDRAKPCHF